MTFDEIKAVMTPEDALDILMLWAMGTWAKDATSEDVNPVVSKFYEGGENTIAMIDAKFSACQGPTEEGLILAAAYLHLQESVERMNDLEY